MDEKTFQNLIQKKHPEYDAKVPHWHFLNETYESPRIWFQKNLFKFVREGEATYMGRLERAYRFNHTREVVDLVNKYLFKNVPERNPDVSPEVIRFRTKATLSGLSLEQFERQVSKKASIYGRVYVVLDNNAKQGEIISKADEKAGNIRLYAYIVTPDQMRDCGFDKDGNYNWVLIQERHRDDNDPFSSTGDPIEKYRLWTKTEWYLFTTKSDGGKETTVELEDYGEHNLGIVPVIKCDHIESDNKYSVPALIEDIAYLDRTVANYCSNLDQIINDQTFSQLVLPASGLLSGITSTISTIDPTDPDILKKRQEIINLGTSQILLFDGENGSAPNYISPDPKQAQLIITTIKQIINEIYHTVGLSGERTKQDNSMGIDNSSGVAKAFDFERVNALLSAKASAMQTFSNRLESMVRIYHGENADEVNSSEEINVEYSTNFDVRGLNDELAIANQFSTLGVPMEIRREQMKDIVDKMWPMLEDKSREEIEKAIDNWEDPFKMLAQQLPGRNGVGIDKSDPLGKNTKQGFPGEAPGAAKKN